MVIKIKRYLWLGCMILLVGVLILYSRSYHASNIISDTTYPKASTRELRWYIKPNDENNQPVPPKEAELLKKYDGYYIGSPDEKVIYITFDAGYENGTTEAILDALKKHNAPAAFFLAQHYLNSAPDLVRRMVDEGHLVCNHTANHKNLAQVTDFEEFKREVVLMEEKFREITGKEMPKYLRPPSGQYSELALQYTQQMGYSTIFWSFAYEDWENNRQPSHEFAFSKIYPRTHNGEVALLHSTSKTNAEILEEVLTEWENQGYRFESLDYLVGKETTQ